MEEQRGQFTFYASFLEAAEELPAAQAGQFLLAVARYGLNGTEPEGIKGAAKALFISVRPTLDNGRKKALAGRKGGEVKTVKEMDSTPEEKQPTKTKKAAKEVIMPDTSWASPALGQAIERWIAYKKERNERYKQVGLNTLIAKIAEKAKEYGEEKVTALIDECISNQWRGIIWDRLDKRQEVAARSGYSSRRMTALDMARQTTERVQAGTAAIGPMEREAIQRMMREHQEEQGGTP